MLCEAVGRFDGHPQNSPFGALNSSSFPRAYVGLWQRFAHAILIFRAFVPCFGLWLMLHKNGRSHIELQPIGEFRHMKWAISPLNTVRRPLPCHRLYKTDCAIDWLSPSTNRWSRQLWGSRRYSFPIAFAISKAVIESLIAQGKSNIR